MARRTAGESAEAGVFISYRHESSRADAGRLAKDLKGHLGERRIFRDIDAIEPGMDFVEAIDSAIAHCRVLLAIIGPGWLAAKDDHGRARLDDPRDYVRLEIEAALRRGLLVIPILVGRAAMPREADLPHSLAPLARRQAHELSESRWDFDVEQLAATLQKAAGLDQRKPQADTPAVAAPSPAKAPARRLGAFAGAALLSAMGVVFLLAGLIDGQGLAFVYAAVALGGAYWLFTKR